MERFTVTVSTTELAQTRWVYLSRDGRPLLSPTPESIADRAGADRALAWAQDFYGTTVPAGHGILVTVTGPLGYFRQHYSGPKGHGMRETLVALDTAVRTAVPVTLTFPTLGPIEV